jgi:hypothetical protein
MIPQADDIIRRRDNRRVFPFSETHTEDKNTGQQEEACADTDLSEISFEIHRHRQHSFSAAALRPDPQVVRARMSEKSTEACFEKNNLL